MVYGDRGHRETGRTGVACLAIILFRLFFTTIFLRIGLESIGWPGKYGVRPDASRRDKNSRGLKNDPRQPPRRKIETAMELSGYTYRRNCSGVIGAKRSVGSPLLVSR